MVLTGHPQSNVSLGARARFRCEGARPIQLSAAVVFALAGWFGVASCVTPQRGPLASPRALDTLRLVGRGGEHVGLGSLVARSPLTVLVFYSPDCHCQRAHEDRLAHLSERYRKAGVQFFWVDSEAGAAVDVDEAEAHRRGLTFPVWMDEGGAVADVVGAEYATYSVVFDRAGTVHFRGAIDSDRVRLHPSAIPYLQRALDDLVAGREVRGPQAEALGCALRKR